ncbi:hypothetical protein Ciccas_007245 [Cichlidogyrus casuarinus]|uniref:non-specific protein-tyrosine kinase n=1 Tax=Cichlidogyrus casuarinus TaxID=1844966 RepID=A0ABD2Q3R6_9PLAT
MSFYYDYQGPPSPCSLLSGSTFTLDMKQNNAMPHSAELYQFLLMAQLDHYYSAFTSQLKVHTVQHIKYVTTTDLDEIGMSKPEQRRLNKCGTRNPIVAAIYGLFKNERLPSQVPLGQVIHTQSYDRDAGTCIVAHEIQVSGKKTVNVNFFDEICRLDLF